MDYSETFGTDTDTNRVINDYRRQAVSESAITAKANIQCAI